jgi:hypothetical protein
MVLTDPCPENDVVILDSPAADVTSPALNYFRLARLTLIEGTDQVHRCVLRHLPEGQTLHSSLDKYQHKLIGLYQRRVISDKQWKLLFPGENNADPRRYVAA